MPLKNVRLRRKLTQEALGERANVSQAAICKIERGHRNDPSWSTVGKLCLALNANPYDVFPLDEIDESQR
jgi:DNA-binding XRE family transcriptional regulator